MELCQRAGLIQEMANTIDTLRKKLKIQNMLLKEFQKSTEEKLDQMRMALTLAQAEADQAKLQYTELAGREQRDYPTIDEFLMMNMSEYANERLGQDSAEAIIIRQQI